MICVCECNPERLLFFVFLMGLDLVNDDCQPSKEGAWPNSRSSSSSSGSESPTSPMNVSKSVRRVVWTFQSLVPFRKSKYRYLIETGSSSYKWSHLFIYGYQIIIISETNCRMWSKGQKISASPGLEVATSDRFGIHPASPRAFEGWSREESSGMAASWCKPYSNGWQFSFTVSGYIWINVWTEIHWYWADLSSSFYTMLTYASFISSDDFFLVKPLLR